MFNIVLEFLLTVKRYISGTISVANNKLYGEKAKTQVH
jgi:hypothetical protein